MSGFVTNIEEKTLQNEHFREVLYTAAHSQLVVMSLLPSEEIGMETHNDVDQFIRIEKGTGQAILNGEITDIKDGSAVVVPAGVIHNIINTSSDQKMKLYTIYAPAHHKDGTIHATKGDAQEDEEDHV